MQGMRLQVTELIRCASVAAQSRIAQLVTIALHTHASCPLITTLQDVETTQQSTNKNTIRTAKNW